MSVWPYTFSLVNNSYKNCVKSLTNAFNIGGVKNAVFAFVIPNQNDKTVDICHEFYNNLDDMKSFISLGGNLRISFGGPNSIMLDESIINENDLYNAYVEIITKSNCYDFDFYIEGENVLKNEIHKKRNNVLCMLQKTYNNLKISYTLSSSQNGINYDAYTILENAVESGVNINIVNCMFINNGWEDSGSSSIDGIKKALIQIQKIWPNKTIQDLNNTLGVFFMIGMNNDSSFFSLVDAKNIVKYLNSIGGIGQLSYWALQRDIFGCSDLNISSLFNVNDFDFYNIFSKMENKKSFVFQDYNQRWIKVDDTTMGDSPEFGYKIIKDNDINNLLSLLEKDDNANIVNYNWSDGKAYIKTKYNINSQNDCSKNKGFTTFIKK
jgi:hypothetical protein